MSAESFGLLPAAVARPVRSVPIRVEYLDFRTVGDEREFRLVVYGPDGTREFRLRMALSAFAAGGVRLQDGPEICYQRLLRALGVGDPAALDAILIDATDVASYREAHSRVLKHRARPAPENEAPPESAPPAPRRLAFVPHRPARPEKPAAPTSAPMETGLREGQRVCHAAFGAGVTAAASPGHTAVQFDQDGLKTFVTSMVRLEVLSAPHTWETGPRGRNRPRRSAPGVA